MEIRSILVNVGLGSGQSALNYAVGMAQEFGAKLIGVAAAEPNLAIVGVEGGHVAAEYYAAESANIERLLGRAEEKFHAAAPVSGQAEWRGVVNDATSVVIEEARRCDIVVAGLGDSGGMTGALDAGHLILSCGRPVLLVSETGDGKFRLGKAVVAWKDTREARRAVSDALPLLQRSDHVKVVAHSEGDLAAEAASLDGIVGWLSLHGVRAESKLAQHSADFLEQLGAASTGGPDLVVSGAYGHSRVREWLFGGVTKDLLDAKNVNRLFSN
jgi:nucleotide-binding universal stress UspA family protein